MPKVNTLLNYFASPKGVKRKEGPAAAETPEKRKQSPKSAIKAKGTPRRGKGKENQSTPTQKRSHKSDSSDGEKADSSPKTKASVPKRRRIVIPSDHSDSGEEFKPDGEEDSESDGSVSEGVSESEPETQSEEDSPQKSVKRSKGAKGSDAKASAGKARGGRNGVAGARAKKASKDLSATGEGQIPAQVGPAAGVDSWPHLKYEFLQPARMKDAKGRGVEHPDYDRKTLYVPKDFLNSVTPGMRQWWELKSKHFDCVLFFKVGKFYELYHMDAVTGVNELSLTFMRGEFAHSGFPEIGYGRYSASLIERGYKVARIEQTENPEMMTQRCNKMTKPTKFDKVVKREICQISTRGTRVYTPLDVEASSPSSSYLLSLVEKRPAQGPSTYGVCFLDTSIGEFHLSEFPDDRSSSRLLTLFAHHPPVQLIHEKSNLSSETLQLLSRYLSTCSKESSPKDDKVWCARATLKTLHEAEYFRADSSENGAFSWPEGLRPYLSDRDSLGLTPAEGKELAIRALGGCLRLLKEYLLDQQLLSQKRFVTYVPPDLTSDAEVSERSSNMVLDAATVSNLRLFGEGSLLSKLDRCCTAFGKRLLRDFLCRPSRDACVIAERQNAIRALADRPDAVQAARRILCGLPDLERSLSKIHAQGNFARMFRHPDGRAIMFEGQTYSRRRIAEFVAALDGFDEISRLAELFADFEDPLIGRCARGMADAGEALEYFKAAFDHEEAKKEGCVVPKKGVDEEYDSILLELEDVERDAARYLEAQRKHFGVKVGYFGSDRKRYQLEVPDSQVKKVGPGYELQSQRKGFRRYYTAEGRELLQRQTNAEEHRERVLKDLNRRIFSKFSERFDTFSAVVRRASTLDVLMSLADYSQSTDTCFPEILPSPGRCLEIRDGRHPCAAGDDFIPNDTSIGAGPSAASFVILTGPNMGGKSTLMRQVGLLTVLAQIGSPVPASSFRLALVDRIFTRLGANDDILAGHSTFLVELTETAVVLRHATSSSLVLLDELGRGTSTFDGTAIAAAVVDRLSTLGCRAIFSTHYHSLVEDYRRDASVSLVHMACVEEREEGEEGEGDVGRETVTFLYKLARGACPKSYGFNAARLAGVPAGITRKGHAAAERMEAEAERRKIFASLCAAGGAELAGLLRKLRRTVKG